jgi:hypothetical protein
MATEPQYISFDQFADNLKCVFDQVSEGNRPVVVERDGETFRLEKQAPEDIWRDYDPDKVRRALKASAGALRGVDLEGFLHDIHEQREQGPGRFE